MRQLNHINVTDKPRVRVFTLDHRTNDIRNPNIISSPLFIRYLKKRICNTIQRTSFQRNYFYSI